VSYLPEKEGESPRITHIDHAISPQAHTPMYLMHKYWARKPHNVVGEYIEHYSKKGEIVLDPFVGSGVTAIEALKRGRRAVAIDLDPIATFITRMTLVPVDLSEFKKAFEGIKEEAKGEIENLYRTRCPSCGKKAVILATLWLRDKNCPSEIRLFCPSCKKRLKKKPTPDDLKKLAEIANMEIPYWYPKDVLKYPNSQEFMKKEAVGDIPNLFTKRNLIALSFLRHMIESIEDAKIRDFMKFTFASRVHLASKMCPVAKPSKRSHWSELSATSFWALQSYWVPPLYMESNVWMLFESGVLGKQGILKGKEESNKEIRHFKEAKSFQDLDNEANILISNQSALSLGSSPARIPKESVDYVFTDPPYGGSVQYMELSALWASWLSGEKKDARFELKFDEEITINDAQKKDFDYYHKMLKASFEQIYDVLKSGRWLTVTFHNTDIKIYNSIIKAVVLAGFDLEKVIYQPPARTSAKGLLQPYGSAVGDYYIRFRKPEKKEKLLSEAEIDKERYERIVVDTVKHIIAERRESVTYSTIINSYPTIFAELKKNGYSFSAPEGIEEVLRKHLDKEFILEDVRDEKGKVIGKKWWLKEKLFLDRASLSERVEATIIGVLNRRVVVSFDDILEEIFTKFQNALTPDTQSIKAILEEYAEKTDGKWQLKKEMRLRQTQHNQIIEWLADIGKKMGFEVYADVPEYRGTKLDLPLSKEKIDRIREIDALWLKDKEIVYEFEVENSTGISDAIIRGSNIPSTDVKRFILIPEERKNLLLMKIAEPILKENIEQYKWNFIFYDTFLSFYEKSRQRKTVEASEIDNLANLSTRTRHEQQTLGQFTK
jgi:16S rRNA G966 N2-methylase RsmD